MNATVIPLERTFERPKISVVMVSFMTGPALLESVKSILDDAGIYELIIVDNGNTASERLSLSHLIMSSSKVRLLQGHGNVGFSKACNYGARIATGDYLLFLNPDAVIAPGFAQKMVRNAQGLTRPWICGGMLRNIHGSEQRGGRRRALTPFRAFSTFLGLHKFGIGKPIHMEAEPLPVSPVPVDSISGAFFITDRASFSRLGGFDENYFLHVEDVDLCRRARQMGGDVVFDPTVNVMHYGSTSRVPRMMVEWRKLKGFVRYFWHYTDTIWSKIFTALATPIFFVAIMGRAWMLSFRAFFKGA